MKMIYQIKHTNNRKNLLSNNFLKVSIIFLLILISVFIFSISNPLRSFVLDVFSPLLKTGDYFYETIFQIPKSFSDKNKIIEENDKLLYEIENMRLNLINYESIKDENERLYKELGLRPTGNFIGAKIIAKPPQMPLDSLFIDKGMEDGINEGDMVLVGERVLIGKIVKVSQNRATVALNSFPEVVSYGYIERTNEPLEIKGIGGGSIQVKVPIDFDIALQDKIMIESSHPYIVAIVGVIEENYSSGFKNVLMSLPANISKTKIIFIEPFINE